MSRKNLVYAFLLSLVACHTKPETADTKFVKWTPEMKLDTKRGARSPNGFPPAKNVKTGPGQASNPAHGLPGHRCDIAVGAPINAVTPHTSNTKTPPPNSGKPIASDMKLNPAHGKPGHRCDLAVGAPLSPKETQVPGKTESINVEVKPEQNAPLNTSLPNKNTTGVRLNPAHGQPHHRCDLAVGAPLT